MRRGSSTEELFLEIFGSIGLMLVDIIGAPITVATQRRYAMQRKALTSNKRTRQGLQRLKRTSLINIFKTKNEEKIQLTKKGLAYSLISCTEYRRHPLPKGWVCIVFFDVPEEQRALRRSLRQLLKKLGFVRLQKSVWTSPYDAAAHIRHFCKLTGMQRWVRIFTGSENDRRVK